MAARVAVFMIGLLFLLFGIAGMFPSLVFLPPPRLRYYEMHMIGPWGFLFGWMPVNYVHNVIYILLGGTGVLAGLFRTTAIVYARYIFFVLVMFTFAGFLPFGIDRLWGVLPLFDWNIMFHSCLAMLLYYYGFIYPLDWGGKEPPSQMIME